MKKILENQTFKLSESDIKKTIMDFLNTIRGSKVCEIQLGGRPLWKAGKMIMLPFMGKYYQTGFSDVHWTFKGLAFYFEVKTPSELGWWMRNRHKYILTPPKLIKNKKHKHFVEQHLFLEEQRAAGAVAEFVCSLDGVKKLIDPFLKKE